MNLKSIIYIILVLLILNVGDGPFKCITSYLYKF